MKKKKRKKGRVGYNNIAREDEKTKMAED